MADLDPKLHLHEFTPVTLDRWRAAAEKALGTAVESAGAHTGDIAIAPLHRDDDRPPHAQPLWSQGGWAIAQELRAREPAEVASRVREGAAGGLQIAWVPMDAGSRAGCRPATSIAGMHVRDAEALHPLVEAARDTGVRIMLLADAAAPFVHEAWHAHAADGRGLAGVLADPLGSLAALGARGSTLAQAHAELAATTREAIERKADVATILADAVGYHDAGASPAVALGAAVAAGLAHLRGLASHGITPAEAAPHVGLRLATGRDFFVAIATLRAARLVWGACLQRLGARPEAVRIWARTSWRDTSRLDLPVNLVRHTLQAFAAGIGGVEHACVQPHTEACGTDDAGARRWAQNIQHLLRGESRLDRVADPAAGSPHVEWLTRRIAESAWTVARALGGPDPEAALAEALRTGAPALQHAPADQAPLVGVDLFPDPARPAPQVDELSPVPQTLSEPVVRVGPLRRERIAAAVEHAREREDLLTAPEAAR